jgi:beta-glucosidase
VVAPRQQHRAPRAGDGSGRGPLDCQEGFHDGFSYANSLPTAASQGIPTASDTFNANDIDTSLTRLFTARVETGDFDPAQAVPWVTKARASLPQGTWTNSNANNAVTETPDRLALARTAADEALVLLKNSAGKANGTTGKLLPLKVPTSGAYKIAVVGTLAHLAPASLYLGDYASIQGYGGAGERRRRVHRHQERRRGGQPGCHRRFHPRVHGNERHDAELLLDDRSDGAHRDPERRLRRRRRGRRNRR